MNKKRLILTVSLFSAILLIGAVMIVAVLASTNQTIKSNVTVRYTAVEVSVNTSANYYTINKDNLSIDNIGDANPAGYPMYEYRNGNKTSKTSISFTPKTNEAKYLAPDPISLDITRTGVVFEYIFENMSNRVSPSINLTANFEISKNIELKYYISTSKLNDFSLILNHEACPPTAISAGVGNKLYVYVKAYIQNLANYASLQGNITCVMDKATEGSVTITENGTCVGSGSGSVRNLIISGNSIQDGTPSVDNPVEIKSVGELITDEQDVNYNKYKVSVVSIGKNLIDFFNEDCLEPAHNGLNGMRIKNLVVGGKYTLSFTIKNSSKVPQYLYFYKIINGQRTRLAYLTTEKVYTSKINFQVEEGYEYWLIRGGSYKIDSAFLDMFATFQVEEGDNATAYEQYPAGVAHIYLDQPLRKVGNVADYIDYANKKVVRRVQVIDNTGTKPINESFSVLGTPIEQNITIPEIKTVEGTTRIMLDGDIPASSIKVEYIMK